MAYNSSNEANIVRQEVYDGSLNKSLDDWLLGTPYFNDRSSGFMDGDTLNITKTGDRATSDYEEGEVISFDNMATSRIDLVINKYKQDAWFMNDKLKQDGWQADAFWAENVRKSGIAMQRDMEKDCFALANNQTLGDLNNINGQPHRIVGGGTGGAILLDDIRQMKLSFDQALVPVENRVLVMDPTAESELNKLFNITAPTTGAQFNTDFSGGVQTGFGSRLNFLYNIYGFNVVLSHNLPKVVSETINSKSVTNGVANIAMSMASAEDMPFMGAIRQRPESEFFRNTHRKRDEWSATCRYGFNNQKDETLGVILTPQ